NHVCRWHTTSAPMSSRVYNRKHHVEKQQADVERTRELFAKSLGYSKPQTQGDSAIAQHFLTNLPRDAGEYAVFLHAPTRDDKR
ncbi:glycosyltransferase family 9 protein, partial [Escherichia coli]|uniref:glycosyltransferase family 9 protein n=1 Tax=Escherichia coli TaxID=562 RepID=UPI00256F5161